MKRRTLPTRQSGMAVVTALLLMMLAVTIVAGLFWQQQVQLRTIENQRLQVQNQWLLRSAIDWARLILLEDSRNSSSDHLAESWVTPLTTTRFGQFDSSPQDSAGTDDSVLSSHIVDAQSRYNLSNLSGSGVVSPHEIAAFRRLLDMLNINPAFATAIAQNIAATQSTTSTDKQTKKSVTTRPKSVALIQLDDLLTTPGLTPEILDKLRDFVTILPRTTPINVNTAPIEVLAAKIESLSLEDAKMLVSSRMQAHIRDIGDLSQRLPGRTPQSLSASDVAVSTNFFLVYGKVRIHRAALTMQALLERNSTGVQLIWKQEK